jgi:uncharacterized protein (DUF697 family)
MGRVVKQSVALANGTRSHGSNPVRHEAVQSIVAAAVGAVAFLVLLCFIAVVAIVTEWGTPNRILTAWLAALAWGLITGACLYLARRLLTGSLPFANIGSENSRNVSVIRDSALTRG